MMKMTFRLDLSRLGQEDAKLTRAGITGVIRASNSLGKHAKTGHGPNAHGQKRFIRRSGKLMRNIRVMTVQVTPHGIAGGLISEKEYSAPVEFGHEIKRKGRITKKGFTLGGIKGSAPAYPFMAPAFEDPAERARVFEILKQELSKAV
jgi:hypothetical protein